jgi:hypothetical protein
MRLIRMDSTIHFVVSFANISAPFRNRIPADGTAMYKMCDSTSRYQTASLFSLTQSFATARSL